MSARRRRGRLRSCLKELLRLWETRQVPPRVPCLPPLRAAMGGTNAWRWCWCVGTFQVGVFNSRLGYL